jgi:hypothetical protein
MQAKWKNSGMWTTTLTLVNWLCGLPLKHFFILKFIITFFLVVLYILSHPTRIMWPNYDKFLEFISLQYDTKYRFEELYRYDL